jgi:hypothetical protein
MEVQFCGTSFLTTYTLPKVQFIVLVILFVPVSYYDYKNSNTSPMEIFKLILEQYSNKGVISIHI